MPRKQGFYMAIVRLVVSEPKGLTRQQIAERLFAEHDRGKKTPLALRVSSALADPVALPCRVLRRGNDGKVYPTPVAEQLVATHPAPEAP